MLYYYIRAPDEEDKANESQIGGIDIIRKYCYNISVFF